MTAIAHGLVRTQSGASALVTAELQYIFRDGPRDQKRERWFVTDAHEWPAQTSTATVVQEVAALADSTGGFLIYDRTGAGETYADLFTVARREDRMKTWPLGCLLSAGQVPSDVTISKEVVIRKFEGKLALGRIVVAPSFPLRDELRTQVARFAGSFKKRGVESAEEEPNALLLALMLATHYRRFKPGNPEYLARNGQVYAYRKLSRDTY
jgi:hypothetical protein